MANDDLKLHLGCGLFYKPGYVNIDLYDDSVADMRADVSDLPFDAQKVQVIEAYHLIEHFDYIHCKYVLSEWFRILKSGGTLILETPDLEETHKKFAESKPETQRITLQWIFGIDSRGMQHKTGFTFELLRSLLTEIGFEMIARLDAQTHTYEPGMRVECRKNGTDLQKQFNASLRKKIRKSLITDDSFFLLPLETHLEPLFKIVSRDGKLSEARLREAIAQTVICNPAVPKAIVSELEAQGLFTESGLARTREFLDYCLKIEIHKRMFSLWAKSKKDGNVEEEFQRFTKRIEADILGILEKGADWTKVLSYISSLEPTNIRILDFSIAMTEAMKLYQKGVKLFATGEFDEAERSLRASTGINPDNPLAHWNLGRLAAARGCELESVESHYERTVSLLHDKRLKSLAAQELARLRRKEYGSIASSPVLENSAAERWFLCC
jgi:predicted SAM-dependent methyltransferase/tetratricopeptide (TPR) repeat protein